MKERHEKELSDFETSHRNPNEISAFEASLHSISPIQPIKFSSSNTDLVIARNISNTKPQEQMQQ